MAIKLYPEERGYNPYPHSQTHPREKELPAESEDRFSDIISKKDVEKRCFPAVDGDSSNPVSKLFRKAMAREAKPS